MCIHRANDFSVLSLVGELRSMNLKRKNVFRAGIIVLVMLLFAANAAGEQCIPLPFAVFDQFPAPGAKGVPVTTNISISFSRSPAIIDYKIEPNVTISNITLEPVSLASGRYTLHPANLLQAGTTYNVTITYGQYAAPLGSEGFCLNSTISWQFTTGTLPAIKEPPVLVTSKGNVTRSISPSSKISPSVIQPGSILNITLTPSPATLFTSYQVNESIPFGFTFVGASAAYTSQDSVYTFTQIGSAPITYTLIASSIEGQYTTFGIFKDASADIGIVSGDPRIWVGVSIVPLYAGSDGRIDRGEAVQAVMDYFNGIITRQEAIEVVMAYFSG